MINTKEDLFALIALIIVFGAFLYATNEQLIKMGY